MNKNEFIDIFRQNADFPAETDIDAICLYLAEHLSEDVEADPLILCDNMKLSFEVFRHLNELDSKKQLDEIMKSVEEAMRSEDSTSSSEKKSDELSEESVSISDEQESKARENSCSYKEGLWQRINNLKGFRRPSGLFAFFAGFVLLLPVLALIASIFALMYIIPLGIVTVVTLIILIPILFFAVLAIIALSYGIANLFTNAPIGLMEIGLGTVLFALTMAIWALNLQFFTFCFPFLFKKITLFIKKLLSVPIAFLFGKEEE